MHGHTLNERRLVERGLDEARQTLELLARTLKNQALVDETGRVVPRIIAAYADTWRLLLECDEDRLKAPTSAKPATGSIPVCKFARGAGHYVWIDGWGRGLSARLAQKSS